MDLMNFYLFKRNLIANHVEELHNIKSGINFSIFCNKRKFKMFFSCFAHHVALHCKCGNMSTQKKREGF